jgi:hypothetical protein
MAFYPCIDIMELVGLHVVQQRQEIAAGFWKHNGSNMRLVNNQIKNIILAMGKRTRECINPKQSNPKTQYKYVTQATTLHHSSGALLDPTTGMHVGRPIWGTWDGYWYVSKARYPTAEDYIVAKTIECQSNPRLTWALPPRYGCYSAWKAQYID